MRFRDFASVLLLLAPLAACGPLPGGEPGVAQTPPLAGGEPDDGETPPPPSSLASWERNVEPVLDRRCVVCHGCYDAPCQMLFSSPEGVDRGSSKQAVYDSKRLTAMEPTRLFIDARSTEGWRKRGFFSTRAGDGASLIHGMLALGRSHPLASGEALPEAIDLDINRQLSCPTRAEFPAYTASHPLGGMPYAVAPLPDADYATLEAWARAGAPLPDRVEPLPSRALRDVGRWEAFLNGGSLREQLVARYLYEHWFLADLVFDDLPRGPFFRVVRSRTPPGRPVDEIATVRPYDDPEVARVWYRLVPNRSTTLHKTHIVYRLDKQRLRRLRELFLESAWELDSLPPYDPKVASNPFVTFDAIPPGSRYRFLLDDAHYFIMTFIRGPVCRGQVAVDVIQDRFFVTFVDPDEDLSVTNPSFLEEAKHLLDLPAESGSDAGLEAVWLKYSRQQWKYGELRQRYYDEVDPQHKGPSLSFIWDGDGENPNAYLTVFRNFDNATVRRGFIGDTPKTAWVMDFPILERIYYNLVAGFDVFGNVTHQVATRLYMDHLRMQAENHFLAFLPRDRREEIRKSWYVGAEEQLRFFLSDRMRATHHGTRVVYHTDDPKRELIALLMARAKGLDGSPDTLNRCARRPCTREGASPVERGVEAALQGIASVHGAFVPPMPEVTLLRVRAGGGEDDLLYALVHDKAHENVAFMFFENARLLPDQDRLTIVRGAFGSYPNFVFSVDAARVPEFVAALKAARDEASFADLADRWGVRRSSPEFWPTVDWLHAQLRRQSPTEAGIYDFARYVDP